MLPTYDMKKFSLEMKKIRNESGFTLDYVSKITSLSHTAIKSLEKGLTIPKIETLLILSNFYPGFPKTHNETIEFCLSNY